MQSLRRWSWGVHPVRRGGRAFQAQPCHRRGHTAPTHPRLYAGAPALSYCRWHTAVPACPCWSPIAGTTTLVHALEKRSGIGSGSEREGSPPVSLLPALWMRRFCCGMGHHVTLQICAIAMCCGPATFLDIVPITTSDWAAMGSYPGNAITSLDKGRKQIFRI